MTASIGATGAELGVRRGLARTTAALDRERLVLAEIMKIRFYPFVLARAEDGRLFDLDGNQYLDFIAGGAVMNVGYANQRVLRAVMEAMAGPWSTTSAIFAHPAQTVLAERLGGLVDGDAKVWFGTSGSEAMDAMGRYFRVASGKPRIIAFEGAFHGQTGGSGALSGMSAHAELASENVTRVPYPDPYRCAYGPCDRDGCSLRCLEPLRAAAAAQPDEVAGLVVEPIESDGGDVIPPSNFLPALREICDEHDFWLGVDEVKVGMGRTGRMFAHDHAGVRADAVAVGKAVAGGLPLSALIARPEILDAGTGTCAYTLAGSPIPCAAALATLDVLADGLVDHAADVGALLLRELRARLVDSPVVGEVRGQGLIIGIEIVQDRESRRPSSDLTAAIVYRCFELGLISIYTGLNHNVIELTPPLDTSPADAFAAAEIVSQAVDDVVGGAFDARKLEGYAGW
jgi:4-aminobutyrate aminotransferase